MTPGARSSVWLERYLDTVEVRRSSRLEPTTQLTPHQSVGLFARLGSVVRRAKREEIKFSQLIKKDNEAS